METSQFEARKIALKQTKEGHVLNLAIHPDEIPDEILRDFVGARYMVVMVRLADAEVPMVRAEIWPKWRYGERSDCPSADGSLRLVS